MIKYNCLICNEEIKSFKDWNNYRINICKSCKFSFIKTEKVEKNEVFSPSEKKFYENAISGDSDREKLFTNNIVKNRINFYEKLLKRKPLNILEVGCGTAAISNGFLKNEIEYTGIEFDENIYKFAISKSRNVIFGDFLKTNFKTKFDILFASQVVEHIEEPKIFFEKCNEVLNKDGILHIDVPNDMSMFSYLRKFFKNNQFYGAIRPPYHLRAYSPISLQNLFLKNNFYKVKTFSRINFDKTFGQLVVKVPLKIALLFRLQQLTGLNSLLVGIAQKKL